MEKIIKQLKKHSWKLLFWFVLSVILFVALAFATDIVLALRIIGTGLFAFMLPGALLTSLVFKEKSLDAIERIVFSVVFSIVLLPLVLFILTKIGLRITEVYVFVTVVALNVGLAAILFWKKKIHNSQSKTKKN